MTGSDDLARLTKEQIEACRTILKCGADEPHPDEIFPIDALCDTALAGAAQLAEPVAWMFDYAQGVGHRDFTDSPPTSDYVLPEGVTCTPLYAAAPTSARIALGREWAVVPREPTALMILRGEQAGINELYTAPGNKSVISERADICAGIYKAMLEAATEHNK